MNFDPTSYRYASRRTLVYGIHGMTATSQPLAAQAGLEMLKRGGNAVDAAVAMAACLTVVEPTSNGIGGDAFAIVWHNGKLHGLNSSGFSPALADACELRAKGMKDMPVYGWEAVTVPGAPAAWAALSKKFGRLPLTETLAPAVNYARNGFAVSPTVSILWKRAFDVFKKNLDGDMFSTIFEDFSRNGEAPSAGEIWRNERQASTLEKIAESDSEAFYRGEIAEMIDAYSKKFGGKLRIDDLAAYTPEWVEPISAGYKGLDVCEIPPNGQGIAALMALKILSHFNLDVKRESAANYHIQIEAMKAAFSAVLREVGDPRFMRMDSRELLSDQFISKLAEKIDCERAHIFTEEKGNDGGTVYLAAVDESGTMISMIQSNYEGFGSGLCVPGCGITLHNRGNNFSLEENRPNSFAPRKKPYHTIIPGFLMKDGLPLGPLGVMGGFMQPQGHVQMILNMTDFGLNPQEALDAPRWQWLSNNRTGIEAEAGSEIINGLVNLGHDLRVDKNRTSYGRGQIIMRNENGVFVGASEPRADGYVCVW